MSYADILLASAFAIIAVLYSSVGQAGATGYIATMGLIGFGPEIIKPTALSLNILVAVIGSIRFQRAGLLDWRQLYPFLILGAPLSLLGGATHLPAAIYQPAVGAVLILAAVQMWRSAAKAAALDDQAGAAPPLLPALTAGGIIGFISGMTGLGGGVFLAPLLLTAGWTRTRQAAALTAAFNLFNSTLAMAGLWTTMPRLPGQLPLWLAAAGLGGLVGSLLGARYLSAKLLRIIIGVLLAVAGTRMILA